MGSLELSLQVLVILESLSHLIITQKFIWDLKWDQKLCGISSSLELWLFGDKPVNQMLDGLFLSMDHVSLETWIVITWISKDLKVAADSLLGLVLGLTLDIY